MPRIGERYLRRFGSGRHDRLQLRQLVDVFLGFIGEGSQYGAIFTRNIDDFVRRIGGSQAVFNDETRKYRLHKRFDFGIEGSNRRKEMRQFVETIRLIPALVFQDGGVQVDGFLFGARLFGRFGD